MKRKEKLKVIAAALTNARGKRLGLASMKNVLDFLTPSVLTDVMDDAKAVLSALKRVGLVL